MQDQESSAKHLFSSIQNLKFKIQNQQSAIGNPMFSAAWMWHTALASQTPWTLLDPGHFPLAAAIHACDPLPMNSASEVQSLAMKLPRRSRIKLACDLLHSAAPITTPPEILHEAARRETEIETGMIKPLSESAFWSGVARRRNRS